MKTKTILIIGAVVLAISAFAASMHHTSGSKMCPLGQAIHGK